MKSLTPHKKCNHWTCNGCKDCGGWAVDPDVEKACINSACKCHSTCDCGEATETPGDMKCGYDCHNQEPYGFVPEAGCPVHDVPSPTQPEKKEGAGWWLTLCRNCQQMTNHQ